MDLLVAGISIMAACILLIVLAVQIQIKALNSKVDKVLSTLGGE